MPVEQQPRARPGRGCPYCSKAAALGSLLLRRRSRRRRHPRHGTPATVSPSQFNRTERRRRMVRHVELCLGRCVHRKLASWVELSAQRRGWLALSDMPVVVAEQVSAEGHGAAGSAYWSHAERDCVAGRPPPGRPSHWSDNARRRPGAGFDRNCGRRSRSPRLGSRRRQDRPRASAGTGVDAVIRARRLS